MLFESTWDKQQYGIKIKTPPLSDIDKICVELTYNFENYCTTFGCSVLLTISVS